MVLHNLVLARQGKAATEQRIVFPTFAPIVNPEPESGGREYYHSIMWLT